MKKLQPLLFSSRKEQDQGARPRQTQGPSYQFILIRGGSKTHLSVKLLHMIPFLHLIRSFACYLRMQVSVLVDRKLSNLGGGHLYRLYLLDTKLHVLWQESNQVILRIPRGVSAIMPLQPQHSYISMELSSKKVTRHDAL